MKWSLADWLRNPANLLPILGTLTLVLYIGTLSFHFVMDDYFQVANNLLIRSWHNLPRVYTTDLWVNFTNTPQPYYRPLFTTWSMLNYSVFQLNAWGWHLGAVLMHIFAVVTVFLLARKLGLEYWTAALAATIFAFHPVHVECAACISAASDPMVTGLFALAFLAFLNGREEQHGNRLAWQSASLLLLACALLTKEMALTFVGIVALYVWFFPAGQSRSVADRLRQCFFAALPYGVLTFGYLFVRKLVLHHLASPVDRAHVVDMFWTWPLVLYNYVRMLLVPVGLGALYYNPYVTVPGLRNFVLPLLAIAAVSLTIWYWARRTGDRVIAFAGLWMIVTLVPALNLSGFSSGDSVHDRYLYLPSVGFVILLAKAIRLLPGLKNIRPAVMQTAAACVVALACIAGSYYTQVYWGSNLLIFYRAHKLYPEYEYATVAYADEVGRHGGHQQAVDLLKAVIKNHPESSPSGLFTANFALANAYLQAGDLTNGRAALDRVAKLSANSGAPAQDMAVIARVYGQLGDFDRALQLCSAALQKDPDLYSVLDVCGNIQLLSGHYPEAEKLLSRAVVIAPDRAVPRHLLGRVYFQTGRFAEAERSFREALDRDSNVYDYHYWYARALAARGDIAHARQELLAALALQRDGAEAKAALAALPSSQ